MAAERAAQRAAYPAIVPTFDGRPATAEESQEILGDVRTEGEGNFLRASEPHFSGAGWEEDAGYVPATHLGIAWHRVMGSPPIMSDPLGLGLAFSWAGQVGFLVASSVVTIKGSLDRHSYSYGSQHEAEDRDGSVGYEKASYGQSEGNG